MGDKEEAKEDSPLLRSLARARSLLNEDPREHKEEANEEIPFLRSLSRARSLLNDDPREHKEKAKEEIPFLRSLARARAVNQFLGTDPYESSILRSLVCATR